MQKQLQGKNPNTSLNLTSVPECHQSENSGVIINPTLCH